MKAVKFQLCFQLILTLWFQNAKYFAHFYSTSLDILRSTLREKPFDDLHLRSHLLAHLRVARSAVLAIIHKIMNECLLYPAMQANEVGDKQRLEQYADDYLHVWLILIQCFGIFLANIIFAAFVWVHWNFRILSWFHEENANFGGCAISDQSKVMISILWQPYVLFAQRHVFYIRF